MSIVIGAVLFFLIAGLILYFITVYNSLVPSAMKWIAPGPTWTCF